MLLDSRDVHLVHVNVKLLANLFHMNIEEPHLAHGIRAAGSHLRSMHFVDSDRRPAGVEHIDFGPIVDVLREIQYAGFVSVAAFQWPDPDAAEVLSKVVFS